MRSRVSRVVAVGLAAPVLGLACIPGDDEAPSGCAILRELPAGLLGAATRSPRPRAACLQASVDVGPSRVLLCGTAHVNAASAAEVRRVIEHCATSPGLRAAAVECDPQTLELICTANETLRGLSTERIRSEGEGLVRRALFNSATVQALARRAGKELANAEQLPLPPLLVRHLRQEGVLWSAEMAEAAAGAAAAGARVVCLESPPRPSTFSLLSRLRADAGMWLRAHALAPGLDEYRCEPCGPSVPCEPCRPCVPSTVPRRLQLVSSGRRCQSHRPSVPVPRLSCDEAMVNACNRASREMAPAWHRLHVDGPDRHMARRVRKLCAELDTSAGSTTGDPLAVLVVVVGARHVPGIHAHLSGSGP